MTEFKMKWSVDLICLILEFRSNVEKMPKPVDTIGVGLTLDLLGQIAGIGLRDGNEELFNICNRLGLYNPNHWEESTVNGIRDFFKKKGIKYHYAMNEIFCNQGNDYHKKEKRLVLKDME